MKHIYYIRFLILLIFLLNFTIIKSQNETLTIVASEDASLGFHTGYPTANTNFGNAVQFSAYCIPGTSGGVNINRGIVKFNLNAFTTLPLFNEEVILLNAGLNLYARPNTGFLVGHFGSSNSSKIKRVIEEWNENTVTWNNQPSTTDLGAVDVPQNTIQYQDYLGLNVTHFVDAWSLNESNNFGVIIQLNQEQANNGLNFYSSDDPLVSKHPSLTIDYIRLSILSPLELCVTHPPISLSANFPNGNFTGNGVTSGIFDPSIAGVGQHVVSYSVTLSNGQVKTTNKIINVVNTPPISISSLTESCNGPVLLSVDTDFPFVWQDGSSSNPLLAGIGTYIATATMPGGCVGADTFSVSNSGVPPVADFTYTQLNNYTIDFVNTSQNADSYFWDFGFGNTSTGSNATFDFKQPGVYTVTLIATNDCGSDTVSYVINITTLSLQLLNIHSPIKVYPNPTSDYLNIDLSDLRFDNAVFSIVNSAGQLLIRSSQTENNTQQIDLSTLKSGYYLLMVETSKGVFRSHFIKH